MSDGQPDSVVETLAEGEGWAFPDPVPGSTIGDRYVVLGRLGAGAMGVVFAAYDPKLDRKVAIKLLSVMDASGSASGSTSQKRLEREARALAQLSHPNVVTVHDVGELGPRVFMAMEYVDGRTLRKWVADEKPSWREIVRVFLEVAAGLTAAHAHRIVHRDIKPDNVMIDGDGRVKVMDFGLATPRVLGAMLESGELERVSGSGRRAGVASDALSISTTKGAIGTPRYMSPEQHLGVEVDARSDQFSFCVALYEALWGRPPFEGKTLPGLFVAVTEGHLIPPPRRSAVPAHVTRAIMRGLANDPRDRFPDMQSLARALDPGRSRATAALVAGGFLIAVVTAVSIRLVAVDGAEACGEVQGPWTEERRAEFLTALHDTGLDYADETGTRIAARIDGYASSLDDARGVVCEDRRAGRFSDGVNDVREVCLDRIAKDIDRAVTLLPDPEVLPKADALLDTLPLIGVCDPERVLSDDEIPPGVADEVEALREEIAAARLDLAAGRHAPAVERLSGVVGRAAASGHAPTHAHALYVLGNAKNEAGSYEESLARYDEALAVAVPAKVERVVAETHVALVGLLGYTLRRPVEARVHARNAELELESLPDADRLRVALASALGSTAIAASEYDLAESEYERAHELARTRLGEDDSTTIGLIGSRAYLESTRSRFPRAIELYEETIRRYEAKLGKDHPTLWIPYMNLAQVYEQTGDHQRCKELNEHALALAEKYGSHHASLVVVVRSLGRAEENLGNHARAEELHRRAYEIALATYGELHHETSNCLSTLALSASRQGRDEEAVELVRKSNAILEKTVGRSHSDFGIGLNLEGYFLVKLAREGEAEPLFREAVQNVEKNFGKEHLHYGAFAGSLADVLVRRGAHEEALPLLEQTLSIYDKTYGPDHAYVAGALVPLADALIALRRRDEARTHLERALRLHRAASSPEEKTVPIVAKLRSLGVRVEEGGG